MLNIEKINYVLNLENMCEDYNYRDNYEGHMLVKFLEEHDNLNILEKIVYDCIKLWYKTLWKIRKIK